MAATPNTASYLGGRQNTQHAFSPPRSVLSLSMYFSPVTRFKAAHTAGRLNLPAITQAISPFSGLKYASGQAIPNEASARTTALPPLPLFFSRHSSTALFLSTAEMPLAWSASNSLPFFAFSASVINRLYSARREFSSRITSAGRVQFCVTAGGRSIRLTLPFAAPASARL